MNEQLRMDDPAPKLWTKDFILLTLSSLFLYLNLQMITPSLPAYVGERFQAHAFSVGLVISLFALSAIATRAFVGKALDTYGRKIILLAGILIFVLSTAGYVMVGTLGLILLVRIVYGVGFGTASTAYGTIASDIIPPRRMGEGMGYFGLAMGFAMHGKWICRPLTRATDGTRDVIRKCSRRNVVRICGPEYRTL